MSLQARKLERILRAFLGLSLVLIHLFGVTIIRSPVSLARSLGPALIVGGTAINQLLLLWVAPIIGALIASAV